LRIFAVSKQMKKAGYVFFILFLNAIIFFSCRKENIITSSSAKLKFEGDTLTFDTVFTTLGSATEYFKVYNPNNDPIVISDIKLAGSSGSKFHLNIDGTSTDEAQNVRIEAHDSLYVFATVHIDPTAQDEPFVVYDSVLFQTNGNLQKVILQAWGQDAHFIYGTTVSGEWKNDKPYVIIHSAEVDSNTSLIIDPGCRIYMHADSWLYVDGQLTIAGTKGDSVVFKGDRLEQYYDSLPGNWQGIVFLKDSHDCKINYTLIRDGAYGIYADSNIHQPSDSNLVVRNAIIENQYYYGISGYEGNFMAYSCLVFNCGNDNVAMTKGGNCSLTNCTFANYGSLYLQHESPVCYLSPNLRDGNGFILRSNNLTANFTNCIIYGSLSDETVVDTVKNGQQLSDTFRNCDLLTSTKNSSSYLTCLFNEDPLFANQQALDFHLTSSSPCISAGIFSISTDLDGNLFKTPPSIGCYQFYP
jgi:hypothetical protein